MKTLVPFEKNQFTDNYKIEASFFRRSDFEIHLEFQLTGPMDKMICPSPAEPLRQDDLWQSTCLEAFLGQKTGGYLEINCSPNGHWNAYEFDSYRQNMRPAAHITVRLTRMEKEQTDARFFVQIISETKLELSQVGLTMVFESTALEKSYWALKHPGTKADFHNAESWTMTIPPRRAE